MKKLTIIDGNSLLFRAYYATSKNKLMTTKDGIPTNAIFAFANMINRILQSSKQDQHLLVVFDTGKKTFRHEKYEDYKAQRKPVPEDLIVQLPIARELLEALNIYAYELDGYEADDIAGTVAKKAGLEGFSVNIYTSDRDYLQLVDNHINVQLIRRGLSDIDEITVDNIVEKFDLTAEMIPDFKGISGDPSDNIPGIPGIGEKGAKNLLNEFGSIENIIANTDKLKGKVKESIEEFGDLGIKCRDLATIHLEVPLSFELEDTLYKGYHFSKISSFANRYELRQFMARLTPKFELPEEKEQIVTYEEIKSIKGLSLPNKIGFALAFNGEMANDKTPLGIVLATGKNNYFLTFNDLRNDSELLLLLEDPKVEKYTYDYKTQKVCLARYNIKLEGLVFDILLASYLLDSNNPDNIRAAFSYFHVSLNIPEKKQLSLFDDEALNFTFEAEIAHYSLFKAPEIMKSLKEKEAVKIYEEIEIPLTSVLAKMEIEGFPIDKEKLLTIGEDFRNNLNQLTESIHKLAGKEFNINSPAQVAGVLFDDLGLPSNRKRSTAVDVLLNLIDHHPIVRLILSYRKYAKLISTYVDGLVEYIHDDGKFHSIYHQALTTTGRLSTSNPNLQNISVRDEEGRQIRKAFYYPEEDVEILSLDYSQIEIRILASLSKCTKLVNAFNQGLDIHNLTASALFKNDNDPHNARRKAKAVNFGIVYGISDFGLSEQLEIPVIEAKDIIRRFYKTYPEIATYRQSIIKDIETNSYVTTLTGRRRYLLEINEQSNYHRREFAKRAATNAPIQGTAADLIKIAMIKIDKYLEENNLETKLVLQIHDELIFRVPINEKSKVLEPLKTIMEQAMEFDVKLRVDGSFGKTWYDAS